MKYRIREQNELKPSGVEWLGDIPINWELTKIKRFIVNLIGGVWGNNEENNENDVICLRVADIDYDKLVFNENNLTVRNISNTELKSRILKKNDLVIEKSGGGEKTPVGRVVLYYLEQKAVCSNFMNKISIDNQVMNSKFLVLIFNSLYSQRVVLESIKQTTGIQNLDIENYISNYISYPNILEQQKIANFLDEKSKIFDESISKKEQLISKLELAKQSLISEVVTGKLKIIENNSKLQTIKREQNELKSSGVECLGDIPKEWEIKKFKYIIKLNPNKFNLDEKIKNDIEVSFVPMENVRRGNINLDNIKNINSVMSGYTFFEEDDILIAKVTPCFENHNCAIAKNLKNKIGFGSTELNVLRCFNKDSIKFVYYYVQTDLFINLGVSQMTGTGGLKRVPSSFFENFKISFPTITEQQKISKYLDEKLIHFDNTIEKTKQSIKKLKLAKEALISQAVTGKIEVL